MSLAALLALNARANLEVSAGISIHATADFEVPLASHGTWVTVGSYGRCWRPTGIAVEWRPYSYGHWVWTDLGWYWESDEPWGWACYHYGNWVYDPTYAWVWIPAVEWAPAWVTWRVGGGYIGWAPLAPPHVRVTLGAPHFMFVQSSRFSEPIRPTTVVVNNTTIINNTTVINNVRREQRTLAGGTAQQVVVNEGPGVEPIQKATGKRVEAVKIQEVAMKTDAKAPAEVRKKASEAPAPTTQTPTPKSATPSETPKTTPERKAVPEKPSKGEQPKTVEPRERTRAGEPDKDKDKPKEKRDYVAPTQPDQPAQPPPSYERPPQAPPPSQPPRHEPPPQSKGQRDKDKDKEPKEKP